MAMEDQTTIPVSERTGVPFDRTALGFVLSDDDAKIEIGMNFGRRVYALLFLQFMAIGMIVSPFCLIDSIKQLIQPPYILIPLNFLSFLGLFASVYLVARRGGEKWADVIGLLGGTFCFAVALGAKLALAPWANYALVAIGQATINFAMLHALIAFDNKVSLWMGKNFITLYVTFVVSGLWVLLMREAGTSWLISTTVPLGGWLFAMGIMLSARKAARHREPHDFVRAVMFILGPPIPAFLIPNRRSARGRWAALRAHHRLGTMLSATRDRKGDEEQANLQNPANEGYGAVADNDGVVA